MARERYGIAEWYGNNFVTLEPSRRMDLARQALDHRNKRGPEPPCPFQDGYPCKKPGGVCGIRLYEEDHGRIGASVEGMAVTCPKRFEQDDLVLRWLADVVGFDRQKARVAREVPFMTNTRTGKLAGKIDYVLAEHRHGRMQWHGLEIQAVYFSGENMEHDFLCLNNDNRRRPPFPDKVRRPDWRSSGAKRLMPQLEIKGPTLRRWQAKLAVCVDSGFFGSIGGPSPDPSHDLDSGDIIWLTPDFVEDADGTCHIRRGHWEVLTLEESTRRLRSSETLSRAEFEASLGGKLHSLS